MRNRQEIAKRLDDVMDKWKVVNADYRKEPLNPNLFRALNELEAFIGPEKGVGLVEYICEIEEKAKREYRKISDLCVADMYPPDGIQESLQNFH